MNYITILGVLFSLAFVPCHAQNQTTYEYDALNRLVKVTTSRGVTEYSYDHLGNRISRKKQTHVTGLQTIHNPEELNLLVDANMKQLYVMCPQSTIGEALLLVDGSGRTLHKQKIDGERIAISTENLFPGYYLIIAYDKKGRAHTRKFVKR